MPLEMTAIVANFAMLTDGTGALTRHDHVTARMADLRISHFFAKFAR